MNAKKIMGAVLVALLAAALFVGAGAAADAKGQDYGTVFIYQDTAVLPTGVWTLVGGTATVTVSAADADYVKIMPGANFVPGTYKLGDDTVNIVKPTASYALTGTTTTSIAYIVANGGKVYEDSTLTFSIESLSKNVTVEGWYITPEDGLGEVYVADSAEAKAAMADKGTYKIQAVFEVADFVEGVPDGVNLDENYFTFTVVGVEDATISASVDTAFSGEAVTFTVEGTPGEKYTIVFAGFDKVSNKQLQTADSSKVTINDNSITFPIGNSGKFTFAAIVNESTIVDEDEKKATAELKTYAGAAVKNGKITIKISAPVVTATVDATSYFIGDNIKISGTSTAATEYDFYIKGVNFKSTKLDLAEDVDDASDFGKEWFAILSTKDVTESGSDKKLDVGTYSIEIKKGETVVKTVAVALKQPFISIIEAPEVIVQGTKVEFLINAEATDKIAAYIFGTNYFNNFSIADGIEQDADIKNQFTITLEKGVTSKDRMATGQYFMVIQHPMYDGEFNVTVDAAGDFHVDETSFLFNVYDRQTANAAQALCDALDSQNFDDMYVKYSFFVIGEDESFTISDIPKEITKGTTLTISGVDTANADATVIVEMISTAFAAVPKEDVNAAAFVLVTTEVAEDGTWEVTLDTSNLNVDEYGISVKIADEIKKNVNINVVEAADEPVTPPTDEPGQDEPGQDEPVAPETPGFGALAALAGLGAVAVLLLRRE